MKMHRNDSHEYLSGLVARCYDPKDPFSWADYKAVEIEFEPLDLSRFPAVTKETGKWIDALFQEETSNRNGDYMLRGLTHIVAKEMELLHLRYGDYSDDYSLWGYNDEELFIYTYCEGDTTLTIYKTVEEYNEGKAETLRWYKEER